MNVEEARALADKATQKEVAPATSESSKKRAREGYAPYLLDFPADCPIEPVGMYGDTYYFLDSVRHLHALKGKDINKGTILPMLGEHQEYKFIAWPRWSKPDEEGETYCTGWRPEWAGDVLIAEASRRGVWDVQGKLRGPGCWRDDDGNTLVMHCGDRIYFGAAPMSPGKVGPYVYSSAPRRPHPDMGYTDTKLGHEILEVLKMWNWARPDADPVLMLGWMAAAILGGALEWRPLIWITGDKATGKSTLQKFTRGIMGDDAVIASSDSTAAGIWQRVGHMTLPVALDEIEASTDNRKAQGIINLARQAGSGDQMLRGGSDHNGASFTVRNCFMFSSILIPPMLGQDVSRMAVLRLQELPKDAMTPPLDTKWLASASKQIRGRLLTNWHRLTELIDVYKSALAAVGHGGRGGDQFGTLLACAWMLLSDDDPDDDDLAHWSSVLDKRDGSDEQADHERCVKWLLSSTLDLYRGGERKTVGSWVRQAGGYDKVTDIETRDAKRALGNVGMGVFDKIVSDKERIKVLCVANDHQGLASLFKDSHWIGQSGADGVWTQALRRVHGAFADRQRFCGARESCTAIPLTSIFGGEDDA